jgi:hypothetical protein
MKPLALAPVVGLLLAGLLLFTGGCRDLERFDTERGEAYCGALVRADFAHRGLLPSDTPEAQAFELELTFDSDELATTPGRVRSNDAEFGLCASSGKPLFDGAALRTVSEAAYDPISQLKFGDGRERNVLVWVDSSCAATFLGVLSLMSSGDLELRLFKPRPAASRETAALDAPGFGQFVLKKRREGCDF